MRSPVHHVVTHTASVDSVFAVIGFRRLAVFIGELDINMMIMIRRSRSKPFTPEGKEHDHNHNQLHDIIHA